MGKTQNIGTFTLTTGSYIISQSDGVSRCAFLLSTGGAATISGNATIKGFGGVSSPIALTVGIPCIVSSNNENEFIDTLTIVVTSGTVIVISNQ